jgi:peptide/nickel transport system ATP-binding protein
MSMRLSHLAVSAGGTTLVDVENLHFERGQAVTIVGESGSGKSLLAHAIMGTLPGSLTLQGSLAVDGTTCDLAERTNRRALWGRVMSLLPQEPVLSLDPTMRVQEQVAEGARSFTSDKASARQSARTLLGSLGLGHATRAYPHTLSGGMAQRVAFAASTIGNAQVLIADEPSKGLDVAARGELAALLQRHLDGGGILLTITHDLDLARELGGTVLVMKDAHVIEQGPAGEVLTEPAHPYTRQLLGAEPVNWNYYWAHSGSAAEPSGQPLISGEGLSKSYGGQRLFSDLSVTVRQGERIALRGPSGSGKTTLGNILLRLLPPDSGRVRHADVLDGGRLQKLYQDPTVAFAPRAALKDSFGDVMRRHRLGHDRLDELMASLRLAPGLLERMPGQVSGGELQRLAIIRAMLLRPALVFADEPTSRLDLITQQETMSCLMDQVDSQGCALMLVTHDQSLADAVAHRRIQLGTKQPPHMGDMRRLPVSTLLTR